MQKKIQHSLFFQHPPQMVWDYLTKQELIEQWLMKNDFQPVVGHDFQFKAGPLPNYNFDGNIYCKVLEVIPYKKLSYSWKGGPGDGSVTMDSVVTWTLHQKENGTELQLEHSGFEQIESPSIFALMDEGWRKNMNKITGLINSSQNVASKS